MPLKERIKAIRVSNLLPLYFVSDLVSSIYTTVPVISIIIDCYYLQSTISAIKYYS